MSDSPTRLGFITPSSNTALEPAVSALLSARESAHFTRVPVTRIALDDASDDQFTTATMESAARLLSDARIEALAWAGTSGSWLGLGRERALSESIATAAGVPATTSSLAMIAACKAYGARRVALVSPYTAGVSAAMATELGRAGLDVVGQQFAGLSTNYEFATLDPTTLRGMIAAASPGADTVLVMCTNLDGVEAAVEAETSRSIRVFDSIAATLWHLRLLTDRPTAGPGELLTNGWLRARAQDVVEALRRDTGSDRTTLRLDLPGAGCSVATCAAESCGTDVPPIRDDGALPQRDLDTVRWLDAHRTLLVQPEFASGPRPPQALIDVYGVRAQMLAAVCLTDEMTGWLSVHSLTERPWSAADRDALQMAADGVRKLLATATESALEVI